MLVSLRVMGNNLILEGYLFLFLPTAIWGRSCGGSEFGDRRSSLRCGWPLFTAEGLQSRAANILGHSQAGSPHSCVFDRVFLEHKTPQMAGSQHHWPETSLLAAVSVGQMP